jgi:biotin transport system substrate-specific component
MVHSPLAHTLWPARGRIDSAAKAFLLAVAGSAVLTLSAKIQVPFYPVPMTMQSMVVLMIGAVYGSRLGAATLGLYLLQGAFGFPVFASGGGLAYMAGPTGGYLAGFLAAAFLAGVLVERGFGRTLFGLFGVMALGHVVIFACGHAWLAMLVGVEKAWLAGVAPFWAATLLKTALGAAAMQGLLTLARGRRID